MLHRLLHKLRVSRRTSTESTDASDGHNEDGAPKLAVLIQSLKFAEKAAAVTSVPFLKGTIGVALAIAECAEVRNYDKPCDLYSDVLQGYKSNDKSLERLALRCGNLILNITTLLESGPGISEDLALLVADLFKCVPFLVEFFSR
jgi:hypothetical protein